jgi:formate--tetrahydrofolate ligase
LNHFYTDSDDEVEVVRKAAEAAGARFAVSKHWELGGEGAEDFANVVAEACDDKPDFQFLYPDSDPLKTKIEKIATEVYGADGVTYSATAEQKIKTVEADAELSQLGVCMVKTHLSLSHDPSLKGRPTGWTLPISDVLTYRGAGFVVPVAGDIRLMPGTASDAAYRRIDVDPETGKVVGLF